jgi:hypothetical protein
MNPARHSHLARRVADVLTGLAALLASLRTGSAAVASPLRADPPGWLQRLPALARLPPLPPGWTKHSPIPGPVHVHAAPAYGMPGWQIILIAAGTAALAGAVAILASRMWAWRRRVTAPNAQGHVRVRHGADPRGSLPPWPGQARRAESRRRRSRRLRELAVPVKSPNHVP